MIIQSLLSIKTVAFWLQTLVCGQLVNCGLYIVFQNFRLFYSYCGRRGLKNVADVQNNITTTIHGNTQFVIA